MMDTMDEQDREKSVIRSYDVCLRKNSGEALFTKACFRFLFYCIPKSCLDYLIINPTVEEWDDYRRRLRKIF